MPGITPSTRRIPPTVRSHPAVPAAACFIGGVAAYKSLPPAVFWWLGAMTAALLALVLFRRLAVVSAVLIAAGWFLCGLLAGQLAAYHYPGDDVALYAADASRLAQLELSLDDSPRVVTNPFDERRASAPKQTALARVVRVRTTAGWRDASGDTLLQIADPHPGLAAGQLVRATGLLQRPAPAQNPGQFNWADYYRDRRVLTSFSVGNASAITILADPGPTPLTAARLYARRLLADGFPAAEALDHALLRALLLGDNDPQLRDVQDQFQRTGTAHHLAISGTHVALLAGVIWTICRLLTIRPRRAAWIALAFTVGYGALALPSPPVVRSVVLAAAMGLGIISGRKGAGLQLLSASVVAMLMYHPPDLFNAGFQLSFGTVLGMILLTGPAMEAVATIRKWNDPDEIVKRSFEKPPTLAVRAFRFADHWLFTTLAVGAVAWMVSMPLIAYHFEQLNPWAIFAGILLAPLVFMALVGGFAKVTLTLLWPAGAHEWAVLVVRPVSWMRRFVDWLASWPLADVPVPPSPWWLIALFYALLLLMLVRAMPDGLKWALRAARVVVLLFIVLPPLQEKVGPPPTPPGTMRVTLLSVGAGQCAVVQPPGGRVVLLDAGSDTLVDVVGKCLGPFLRHARVAGVDTLVLSHADHDHVSAAVEVVRAYGVREVLTGDRFVEHGVEGDPTRRLVADLEALNRPPRTVLPGQRTPLGKDTAIEVLWPPPATAGTSTPLSTNDGCLVFRLTHAGGTILFPGDIQDGAMRELLKDPTKLKAEVLVAMHHGSAESLSLKFVEAVDPKVIVSSNDRTLTGKQRQFDRLTSGRTLYRTNECGAVTIVIDEAGRVIIEPFVDAR